jgi:tetratricopeptide (TPR) repeat protein
MPEPPEVKLTGLEKEVIDAIEGARQKVREQPCAAEAWAHLGAVLRAHDFGSESNFCFAVAEKLDPKDYRWPYLIGLGLLGTDKAAALSWLRRAVELGGDEAAPRLRLGEELLEKGELAEAETLFRPVLGKKGLDNARAHLGLGRIALERNDPAGALDHLKRAVAEAPGSKAIHAALAQAYRQSRDEKAAAEELRILGTLNENGSWPEPCLQYVNRCWVGMRARMVKIDSFVKTGYREEAVVAARELVRLYPDSALARLVLGEMLNRAENPMVAEPVLRQALRMDPKRGKTHFELGFALQKQSRFREAAERYRKALGMQPDFAVAHFNLGMCLDSLRDQAGALKEFEAAVRYSPGYIDAHLRLGLLLVGKGQHKEARRHFEEAARLAPSDARPRELLAKLRNLVFQLTKDHIGWELARCWLAM